MVPHDLRKLVGRSLRSKEVRRQGPSRSGDTRRQTHSFNKKCFFAEAKRRFTQNALSETHVEPFFVTAATTTRLHTTATGLCTPTSAALVPPARAAAVEGVCLISVRPPRARSTHAVEGVCLISERLKVRIVCVFGEKLIAPATIAQITNLQ